MSADLDLTPYIDDLIAWRSEVLAHMAGPDGLDPRAEIRRKLDRLARVHGVKGRPDLLPDEVKPEANVLTDWHRLLVNALDEGRS